MAIKQAPEKPGKFHKDTFDKTTEARRQTVLSAALQQFATKGYSATNINDIAKQAHISIGALYSYFASKEDLFLTIVNSGYDLMTEILYDVAKNSTDVYDYVARMESGMLWAMMPRRKKTAVAFAMPGRINGR